MNNKRRHQNLLPDRSKLNRRRGPANRRLLRLEALEQRNLLAAVPELIHNIAAGGASSLPEEFVELGTNVYFAANETQLWRTNPNTLGAVMIKDIGGSAVPGGDAYLSGLYNHNGTLVFAKIDRGDPLRFFDPSDDQVQLWKSNGTTSGTVMVKDFGLGSSTGISQGAYFISLGTKVFTPVSTPSQGKELWKSDLTTAGTTIVRDIIPGIGDSYPYSVIKHQGQLYFSADNGTNGRELWKTDGTTAGTVMVKDISNSPTSRVGQVISMGTELFFGAENINPDGDNNTDDGFVQLWKSNGTSSGTVLVKDFGVGSNSGGPSFTNVNGTLFGVVSTPGIGSELWKSNGTSSGTVLVKDINPGTNGSYPSNLTNFNGTLFFAASTTANGQEIWRSNGTSAGTILVRDINPGSAGQISYNSLTVRGGHLYFAADDGSVGTELWRTDGTSAGTILVSDLNVGPDSGFSTYTRLHNLSGNLFFSADNGATGEEPWILRSDPHDTVGFLKDTSLPTRTFYDWSLDANGNFLWNGGGVGSGDTLTRDEWPSKGLPIVGDWNGDGFDDLGIFTPSVNGKSPKFSLDFNGNQQWDGIATDRATFFGGSDSGNVPIAGDWNGDGKDEIGVWLASVFMLDINGNGVFDPAVDAKFSFGWGRATPLIGDWNGDGRDDVGFFKDGHYYLDRNGNRIWEQATEHTVFGGVGVTPIAGDWNGDGKDEVGHYQIIRNRNEPPQYLRHEFVFDMNGNFGNFEAAVDLKTSWSNFSGQSVATGLWKPAGAPLIGTEVSTSLDAPILAQADLSLAIGAAVSLWGSAGLDTGLVARLSQVQFTIADLPGATLGQTAGNRVLIDTNGAGLGWDLGSVVRLTTNRLDDDSASAFAGYDLLTVVLHELGHAAGLDHSDHGVMQRLLKPGQRELPSLLEVDHVLENWNP